MLKETISLPLIMGVRCRVSRVRTMTYRTWLCGYVRLWPGHPWEREADLSSVDVIDVHGGVTYAKFEADGCFWVGFDCAHWGDGAFEEPNGVVKTEDFVMAELARLVEQAIDADPSGVSRGLHL